AGRGRRQPRPEVARLPAAGQGLAPGHRGRRQRRLVAAALRRRPAARRGSALGLGPRLAVSHENDRGWQMTPRSVLPVLALLAALPCRAADPEPVRLTRDGDFKQHLHWSPDGKKLLFTRIHQGKMGLWTVSADGGDLKALLPDQKAPHFDGHWSPDSKQVV